MNVLSTPASRNLSLVVLLLPPRQDRQIFNTRVVIGSSNRVALINQSCISCYGKITYLRGAARIIFTYR